MNEHVSLESIFKVYSLAIVVGDKARNSDEISIFPIESQFEYSGIVDTKEERKKIPVTNEETDVELKTIFLEQVTNAVWIPLHNSNRASAPDVCNGERVMLYKMGSSNTIFWDTIFHEADIRKKEHLVEIISNTDDLRESLTFDNTYNRGMDAVDKQFNVAHTSNNDGEVTTHDIVIDTSEGILDIKDGKGNFIKKDSKANSLTLVTVDSITFRTKKVLFECDDFTVDAKNIELKSNSYVNDTVKWLAKAVSATFKAPVVKMSGALNVTAVVKSATGVCKNN